MRAHSGRLAPALPDVDIDLTAAAPVRGRAPRGRAARGRSARACGSHVGADGGEGEPTRPDRALSTPPHACLAPRGAHAAPAPAHRLMSWRVAANARTHPWSHRLGMRPRARNLLTRGPSATPVPPQSQPRTNPKGLSTCTHRTTRSPPTPPELRSCYYMYLNISAVLCCWAARHSYCISIYCTYIVIYT